MIMLGAIAQSLAFGPADADAIFAAFNKAFYHPHGGRGFYAETTAGGKSSFWMRAEQMEMVLDAYERTTNADYLAKFHSLFDGFIAERGATWEQNEFNDDIMWMVIACARAQQLSGNPAYLKAAKTNFDMCYGRAWSADLGGGLWWKTSKLSKNACVNGPGAIAAYLLYQDCGEAGYLAKARDLYQWERATLYNPATGAVHDNLNLRGRVEGKLFTYNQGTFIGAANFLGYTNDAQRAADFTKRVLCHGGLMPSYGQDGDGGGFNGICARWLAKYMKDRGAQAAYLKWLQANAQAAWQAARPADGLSWSRWSEPTPAGQLNSWACSSSVVILQVVPPN
jgi:predicted alpha-1,6-mannanase (GH76 family)